MKTRMLQIRTAARVCLIGPLFDSSSPGEDLRALLHALAERTLVTPAARNLATAGRGAVLPGAVRHRLHRATTAPFPEDAVLVLYAGGENLNGPHPFRRGAGLLVRAATRGPDVSPRCAEGLSQADGILVPSGAQRALFEAAGVPSGLLAVLPPPLDKGLLTVEPAPLPSGGVFRVLCDVCPGDRVEIAALATLLWGIRGMGASIELTLRAPAGALAQLGSWLVDVGAPAGALRLEPEAEDRAGRLAQMRAVHAWLGPLSRPVGWGRRALEAVVSGRAVVLTRETGPVEWLGSRGFPREELPQTLAALGEDSGRLSRMAGSSRSELALACDPDRVADTLLCHVRGPVRRVA